MRLGGDGGIEGQGKMGKGVACGVSSCRLFISCACRKINILQFIKMIQNDKKVLLTFHSAVHKADFLQSSY